MRVLKYFGFLGFLGCLYFIYGKLSLLSGLLFFSFFRIYFLEEASKLPMDVYLTKKTNEIGQKVFILPLVTLFIIANSYTMKKEFVVILSILTIVITFVASAMIPYYYAKANIKKLKKNTKYCA